MIRPTIKREHGFMDELLKRMNRTGTNPSPNRNPGREMRSTEMRRRKLFQPPEDIKKEPQPKLVFAP